MIRIKEIQKYLANDGQDIFVRIGILITVGVILITLVLFNIFTTLLIFGYFDDIVYEVIFFFILLAIDINLGIKITINFARLIYED